MSPLLSVYGLLATLSVPAISLHHLIRHRLSPSDFLSLFGHPPLPPPSPLLWLSGFSVGELSTAFTLIHHVAVTSPSILANVSTILFTSPNHQAVLAIRPRLPALQNVLAHATLLAIPLPIDAPIPVRRFLRRVQPAAAIAVEFDRKPALLASLRRRGVPLALLDGRLSERSHSRWSSYAPSPAREIFGAFAIVTAPTEGDASRIAHFCGDEVRVVRQTSLKFLTPASARAPPEGVDEFVAAVAGRPTWVAASTHPPDEQLVLAAHAALRERQGLGNALLIVAPRHPERGASLKRLAVEVGFEAGKVLRRSEGQDVVKGDTAVYVADTLGELRLFYSAAPVALIGNSFAEDGNGYNFAEAAHFGCCVVHGPSFGAFDHLVEVVREVISEERIMQAEGLKGGIGELWSEPCVEAEDGERVVELVAAALLNSERTTNLGMELQAAVQNLSMAAENEVLAIVEDLKSRASCEHGGLWRVGGRAG